MTDIDLNAKTAHGILLVAQVALMKAGHHGLPDQLEKIDALVAQLTEERDGLAAVVAEMDSVWIGGLGRPLHLVHEAMRKVLKKVDLAATLAARDAEKKAEGWDEGVEAYRKHRLAKTEWRLSDTSDPKPNRPKNPYRTPQQGEQG